VPLVQVSWDSWLVNQQKKQLTRHTLNARQGNKGGNAIRIKYIPATPDVANPGATVLTFVNAHLAAFDEMFEKRNADFHDLSKRLQFDLGEMQGSVEGTLPVPVTCNVYESDALFWMASYLLNC
jgi:phosphatidylinositol-bisphosphatase